MTGITKHYRKLKMEKVIYTIHAKLLTIIDENIRPDENYNCRRKPTEALSKALDIAMPERANFESLTIAKSRFPICELVTGIYDKIDEQEEIRGDLTASLENSYGELLICISQNSKPMKPISLLKDDATRCEETIQALEDGKASALPLLPMLQRRLVEINKEINTRTGGESSRDALTSATDVGLMNFQFNAGLTGPVTNSTDPKPMR